VLISCPTIERKRGEEKITMKDESQKPKLHPRLEKNPGLCKVIDLKNTDPSEDKDAQEGLVHTI